MASPHQASKFGAEARAFPLNIPEDPLHLLAGPSRHEVHWNLCCRMWLCDYSNTISFVFARALAGAMFGVRRGALTLLGVTTILKAEDYGVLCNSFFC